MIIHGTHETPDGQRVAEWFGNIVGRKHCGPYAAMGWLDSAGQICTAVLFTDYNGANIELHMVGTFRRQSLRDAFRYAFITAKALRITAKPYRCAERLIEMLDRLGFEREGEMKNYYGPGPSSDALVFRLDRTAAEKWMT